jgi:hypothetical protein
MTAHEHPHLEVNNKNKRRQQKELTEYLTHIIPMLIGALMGIVLTALFSIIIFAFVIKAFITSDEMSLQLLNLAITPVGTTLSAVLGYLLGRVSTHKPGQGS